MALIKCSECGKEISDKSKICINCGNPIVKKIYCKECGKEIDISDTKCPNCGCTNTVKRKKRIIISSIILVIIILIIILCNLPKKLQENLWYANEEGRWVYKFSNGELHYNWGEGRTSVIGTYSINGNKVFVQEDKAFGASYTCIIKSNKQIECECNKEKDENCENKNYYVAKEKSKE